MRISFDLDDTLICHGGTVPCERRLSWLLRAWLGGEPLRRGAVALAATLRADGHELWVYTTSHRNARRVRRWLRVHGVRVDRVVNGAEHDRCFGAGSSPTKRPHAFGIDLHVDDAPGVKIEGDRHGFAVCVVDPADERWTEQVLAAVAAHRTRGPHAGRLHG